MSACECATRSLKQASHCANGRAAQIALLSTQLDAEKKAHVDNVANERANTEKVKAEMTRNLEEKEEEKRRARIAGGLLGGVAGMALGWILRALLR